MFNLDLDLFNLREFPLVTEVFSSNVDVSVKDIVMSQNSLGAIVVCFIKVMLDKASLFYYKMLNKNGASTLP